MPTTTTTTEDEHVEAMLTELRAIPNMRRAAELASYDPIVPDVASVDRA